MPGLHFLGKRPGLNLNLRLFFDEPKIVYKLYFPKSPHLDNHIRCPVSHVGLHPVGSPRNLAQKKIDADGFFEGLRPSHHFIFTLWRIVWQRIEVRLSDHFRLFCCAQRKTLNRVPKKGQTLSRHWVTHARTKSLSEKKGAKKLNLRPIVHQRDHMAKKAFERNTLTVTIHFMVSKWVWEVESGVNRKVQITVSPSLPRVWARFFRPWENFDFA